MSRSANDMAVTVCIDSVPCRVDSCAHERGVEKVKLPPSSNSGEFNVVIASTELLRSSR